MGLWRELRQAVRPQESRQATIAPCTRQFADPAFFLASIAEVAFNVPGRFERFPADHAGAARPCGCGAHAQYLHSDRSRIAATRNRESRGLIVPKCSEAGTGDDDSVRTQVASIEVMARPGRFERPTSGSGDHFQGKS